MNRTGIFTSAKLSRSQPPASLTNALITQDKPLWDPTKTVVAWAFSGIFPCILDVSLWFSTIRKFSSVEWWLTTATVKSSVSWLESALLWRWGNKTGLLVKLTVGLKLNYKFNSIKNQQWLAQDQSFFGRPKLHQIHQLTEFGGVLFLAQIPEYHSNSPSCYSLMNLPFSGFHEITSFQYLVKVSWLPAPTLYVFMNVAKVYLRWKLWVNFPVQVKTNFFRQLISYQILKGIRLSSRAPLLFTLKFVSRGNYVRNFILKVSSIFKIHFLSPSTIINLIK